MRHHISRTAFILALGLSSISLQAQIDDEYDEIVVTGMRVTAGGAQDINYFRGSVDRGEVPHADTMTSEGLLSQHDLILTSTTPCMQTLCLNGEAMKMSSGNMLGADYFLGLAFDTNIDGATWSRDPLNLVVVIDKSGSMSGEPLEQARKSVRAAIGKMQPGDQISIVLYGNVVETYLEPTKITRSNKGALKTKVKAIESRGSTNMEAGLVRAFELAKSTQADFDGMTRVMLFTDERPNVGKTDAGSFMGMAEAASEFDIGMTTVGVGIIFGAELATKVSSVRGGNLFFVRDDDDIERLFSTEFDFMVSEVARDMTVRVTPRSGYKISGIYGVPQDSFTRLGDSVEMSVATAFLSSAGGGLFLGVTRDNPDLPPEPVEDAESFATAQLIYTDSATKARQMQTVTAAAMDRPSENLQKASLLSQQYVALRSAANSHHEDNDQMAAFQTLKRFSDILEASPVEGLDEERELVSTLTATTGYLSGNMEYAEKLPASMRLINKWKIMGVTGSEDLRRGDVLQFDKDDNFTIFRRKRSLKTSDEVEYYRVNDEQVYLSDSDLTLNYKFKKGGKLLLTHPKGDLSIRLSPYEAAMP